MAIVNKSSEKNTCLPSFKSSKYLFNIYKCNAPRITNKTWKPIKLFKGVSFKTLLELRSPTSANVTRIKMLI